MSVSVRSPDDEERAWLSAIERRGHPQERFCADRIRAWWHEHRAEFLAQHGRVAPAAVP